MHKEKDVTYSVRELLAVCLARELNDGEHSLFGANSMVAQAGRLLAHLLHGPNMKYSIGISQTNLFDQEKLDIGTFELTVDWRVGRFAEFYMKLDEAFEYVDRLTEHFLVRGLQVDKYGNTNLVGLKGEDKSFKMRGPGVGGSTGLAASAKRYYIYMEKHDRRRFVEKCDYISAVGWGTPEMGFREQLKLPGGGPKLVFTPLCITDFDSQTKRMRLKSVHPHTSVDEVIANTGFDLIVPNDVPRTKAPTVEELEALRNRVDPDGLLRGDG